MKNILKKPTAIALSLVLLISSVSVGVVYALNNDTENEKPKAKNSTTAEQSEADLTKDETVYVLSGSDGSVQKVIVSDWIKNAVGSDHITDKSELKNVENVKGEETYTMNADNMRVWDAQGNDIYYQGDIEKELPVNLSVSYKLNGKSISPSELAGKSGKLSIRFDYKNKQYETVKIDGKQEKIYVPFTMLTGILLDGDLCRNVEVSNGKLINDGSHIAVIGIAFPGLQENLNVDADTLEIPDYVEFSADVKDFEMTNTVTIATNEVFNQINTEKLNSLDELTGSLDQMTEAMSQLMDGSSQLYDGLGTLLDKSGELIEGINKLADGANKLKNGAGTLDKGAGELVIGADSLANGTASLASGAKDLSDGAKELAEGLNTLASNNDTLNGGAKQVFESLLNTANTQLSASGLSVPTLTIGNYAKILNDIINSLDKENVAAQAQAAARQTVTAKVNEQKDTIQASVAEAIKQEVTAQVTDAVKKNVEGQVLGEIGLNSDSYEADIASGAISEEQQAQISAAVEAQMNSDAILATIQANVNAQMQSKDIQNMISLKTDEQIKLLIEQNMNSPEVQGQITAALEAAKSGAASVSALKEQLDSYNQFYIGLYQYTAGVTSAKDGANQINKGAEQLSNGAVQVNAGSEKLKNGTVKLKDGTKELYTGMNELYNGIFTLKNGSPVLVDGVSQLRDGAMQLSDGLKEFNEKGVQKFVDAVDGDIGGVLTRLKATVDVSKDYKSFSGISDDMDGQVKFIYRTDAIDVK